MTSSSVADLFLSEVGVSAVEMARPLVSPMLTVPLILERDTRTSWKMLRMARTVSLRKMKRTRVLVPGSPPRDCRHPSTLPPAPQVVRRRRHALVRVSEGRNSCETLCRTTYTRKACDLCVLEDAS